MNNDQQDKIELRKYLAALTITSENIGTIRSGLFTPWKSDWNGLVRDETASRENKSLSNRNSQQLCSHPLTSML
jgi:hypothetical protein